MRIESTQCPATILLLLQFTRLKEFSIIAITISQGHSLGMLCEKIAMLYCRQGKLAKSIRLPTVEYLEDIWKI